ncbi:hypothetical protein [Nitrospira moscoviensis]|uniref:Uncharacterized protein n=1 Tax=Nitrospira moscoviensis TaxID=42253 RepID=A0A0K2GBV9_NITMO|nr:hypothetical protein [Nitrospira moscoviensis]ALA58359.1 hypothetical protein NITMOv2_1940 [Nitrospira moscoviensis]
MDVIGDASLAIANFLRFGLDGPSRYEDIGEQYLRLYGVLNAAYIQQQAVLKLYLLMNCPNPRDIKGIFHGLEIRTLRHQLASHSLDFLAPGSNSKQAFVPVRIDLAGFTCTLTENRGDRNRAVKLDEALDVHCEAVIDALDRTYEKSIRTLFRGQANRMEEFRKRLNDLRFEKGGNLILRAGEGDKQRELRIVFVAPKSKEYEADHSVQRDRERRRRTARR